MQPDSRSIRGSIGLHRGWPFLIAVSLLLSACDPPTEPVEASQVVGVWEAEGPDGRTGTLELKDDGTFEGVDLPDRVFYPSTFHDKYGGPPDWGTSDNIAGTWTTEWNPGNQLAFVIINIEGRGDGDEIHVKDVGDRKYLSYYYTDPDSAEFLDLRRVAR
jgi:hypothetical protein